jgi:hypothetical protein
MNPKLPPPPKPKRPDDPFTVVGPSRYLRVIAAIVEALTIIGLVALAIMLGMKQ